VDERARVSVTPPQFGGWSVRLDARAATQGGFDPVNAPNRSYKVSDISRGFSRGAIFSAGDPSERASARTIHARVAERYTLRGSHLTGRAP